MMSGEEGSDASPEGVWGGVQRCVAADKVVAEGELSMPRDQVLDDVGVAGDDERARAEATDIQPRDSAQGCTKMTAFDM